MSLAGYPSQKMVASIYETTVISRRQFAGGVRDENLARLGQVDDSSRFVYCPTSEAARYELHFTRMDRSPNPQPVARQRLPDCQGRRQCHTNAIESDEKSVTRGVDFHAVVLVENLAHRDVVVVEESVPSTVTDPHQTAGRLDDVREDQRLHDPIHHGRSPEPSPPDPHDGNGRLIPDHPDVVPRGDVEDITGDDTELRPIVQPEPQFAPERDSDMAKLTALAPDERLELFTPVPAWLTHDSADDELAEPHRFGTSVGKYLDFIGSVQRLD